MGLERRMKVYSTFYYQAVICKYAPRIIYTILFYLLMFTFKPFFPFVSILLLMNQIREVPYA